MNVETDPNCLSPAAPPTLVEFLYPLPAERRAGAIIRWANPSGTEVI